MYELGHPQYTYAVLVIKGYGEDMGLKIELPSYEAEDCEECGEEACNMKWEDGQWVCPDCGTEQ